MPALPAGLRSRPSPSAAATTAGWFQKTSGTSSGTKLQVATTVSPPVGIRSMIQGATTAPRMPPTPAAVSTRPICTGGKPAWISRRIATKNSALTTRLTSGDQTSSTRKNGRDQGKRRPSAMSARAGGAARSAAGGRQVGADPAEQHARERVGHGVEGNGSQRVTAYSTPPSGPPSSDGDVLAGLDLAQRGGQLVGGDDRAHGGISAGMKTPAATPVSSATTSRCGTVSAPSDAGDRQRAVEEDAGARSLVRISRRRSTRSASTPAGSRAPPCRAGAAPRRRRPPAVEPVSAKASSGKTNMLTRAAELADRLADPEDGEVVVPGERRGSRSCPHHIVRNNSCARVRAEFATCAVPSRAVRLAHGRAGRTTRGCCAPSRTRCATGSSTELAATGSMRAADVARELGIPANQASFHLRQLAKYGLVEEAPEAARDKRDRVWRAGRRGRRTASTSTSSRTAGRQGRRRRLPRGPPRPGPPPRRPGIRRRRAPRAPADGHRAGAAADQGGGRRAGRARSTSSSSGWRTRDPGASAGDGRRTYQRLPGRSSRSPSEPRRARRLRRRSPRLRVPARLRPADPAAVAEARARLAAGDGAPADLRLLTKHFLARARGARARPVGRGAGAAVRRRAGGPRRPAHPRHAPGRGRDGRRHLDRARDRRAHLAPTPRTPAGSAPAANAPT